MKCKWNFVPVMMTMDCEQHSVSIPLTKINNSLISREEMCYIIRKRRATEAASRARRRRGQAHHSHK